MQYWITFSKLFYDVFEKIHAQCPAFKKAVGATKCLVAGRRARTVEDGPLIYHSGLGSPNCAFLILDFGSSQICQIPITLTMTKSTITLASGKEMPLVGFGLWKVPKETVADTVYNVRILPSYWKTFIKTKSLKQNRPLKRDTDCSTAPMTTRTKRKPAMVSAARLPMASSPATRSSSLRSYGTTTTAASTRWLWPRSRMRPGVLDTLTCS